MSVPLQITVPDGGEDARIEWKSEISHTNYLPSNRCIIQIKAAKKFDTSDIEREIIKGKKGKKYLNKAICEAIETNSDYLILCSLPCVEKKVKTLEKSICEIVAAGGKKIDSNKVHFYDANKISDWVMSHPSVALWLNSQGRTRPYSGFYTHTMLGKLVANNKWVNDKEKRYWITGSNIKDDKNGDRNILDFDSIRELIYEQLELNGIRSIRICGPSGYGKSRFAYEIFNKLDTIGEKVHQSEIVYTEYTGDDKIRSLALEIAELQYSTILIVDECPDELHQKLVEFVNYTGSKLRIITIDIETGIHRSTRTLTVSMQPASNNLLFGIIRSKTPNLAADDVHFIIKLSEGFPRMAILAAEQAHNQKHLVTSVQELILRILWNKDVPDHAVQRSIESLCLFDWVGFSERWGREAEFIATHLLSVTEDDFIQHISRFIDRGIVGHRGDLWQINPIPLAAILAQQRVRSLPEGKLLTFFNIAPIGLKLSLLRRFQWIDTTTEAQHFANVLLQHQNFGNLAAISNSSGAECFYRLVHINPDAALTTLEKIIDRASIAEIESVIEGRTWIVEAFGKLLFPKKYFHRAVMRFRKFAIGEAQFQFDNNSRRQFKRLFQIHFCNTEASLADRLGILENGIASLDRSEKELSIMAIDNMLQFPHFRQWHIGIGQIGSHKPLKEYEPIDETEVSDYIISCVRLLKKVINEEDELSLFARKVITDHFKVLLDRIDTAYIHDLVNDFREERMPRFLIIKELNEWIYFQSKDFKADFVDEIKTLYKSLLPESHNEMILLHTQWLHGLQDPETTFEERSPEHYYHSQQILDSLAESVVNDSQSIASLIENLLWSDAENTLFFCKKLAECSNSPAHLFNIAVTELGMGKGSPNIDVIRGIILGMSLKEIDLARNCISNLIKSGTLQNQSINPLSAYEIYCFDTEDATIFIDLLDSGKIHPQDFNIFNFLQKLCYLPIEAWHRLIDKILSFGQEGVVASIIILSHVLDHKPERSKELHELTLRVLFAVDLFDETNVDTDSLVESLISTDSITSTDAYRLGVHLFDTMATLSHSRRYHDVIYKCFEYLIGRFPDEIWKSALPWFDRTTNIPFDDLLSPTYTDHLGPGLIFGIAKETYMRWVEQDLDTRAKWVIAWLPIISKVDSDITWHPATESYVRTYHSHSGVLEALKYRLVSRTLIEPHNVHPSSLLPMLKKWQEIPEIKLQVWAGKQITEIQRAIEEEQKDVDERMVRNR
ncbi:hypothetical protein J2Y45_006066 [Dyadobacter sp. BE34]|uniref:Uncharacterized protein n=1 Tax=Dyadobacter fermentans TaxID=94254 RepID=A0ABU1R667_9BACT|nr:MULTISPECIES: hypothetical protein [Dyadobacter]MDR6808853.1 hypothetical protein [Dyadobacter fermentans]MDR7046596.1 hypothetical protein [Dyadobacter sp. BE242]MDR7200909.1 hypothetical protein [Dyadobacter sp. BE34]MDR7218870.1 hypothetical protein [Dyadobacter sp. BE31]MDR7264920.1 hypothetical protein [Dyadobacter sp. BE32]